MEGTFKVKCIQGVADNTEVYFVKGNQYAVSVDGDEWAATSETKRRHIISENNDEGKQWFAKHFIKLGE